MSVTLQKPAPEPEKTPEPDDQAQAAVDDDQAAEEAEPGTLTDRLRERLRENAGLLRVGLADYGRRGAEGTRLWLGTADVTDEQLIEEVRLAAQRKREQHAASLRARAGELHAQIAQQRGQDAGHGITGDSSTVVNLRRDLARVEAELAEHAAPTVTEALPPAPAAVRRARSRKRLERATALVGAVLGGIMLPLHDIRLLVVSLPAAAVALYRMGARVDQEPQQAAPVPVVPEQGGPAEGTPAFAAALAAAQVAAAEATAPGALAAQQVTQVAAEAAQVTGSADLVAALAKARIIDRGEEEETSIVGLIRPDGPGWTATIELPGGKPAEVAISRAAELASALRVKTSQLQIHADSSEDGHEGRFVLWVASRSNPFASAPVPSELIGAESWDFWRQGVPLGTNARGVRKILNLIWSSLLIGGLMGYGKSYKARLVAAAAVLDPYVRIYLLSGKAGADWAALKLVAHRFVVGNSASTVREMHATMEQLVTEMAEHGEQLEKLFEKDPALCPEGKITPVLARDPELMLTLLVVDELQEILDAAATIKLQSADDLDEDGGGKGGKNGKAVMVSLMARYVRVARAVGGMAVFITQRPDATSVPAELREVCAKRACFRVKGRTSSVMVLGEDAVKAGAAPHLLTESQKGVAVLDEGAEDGHDVIKADMINLDDFRRICEHGRELRIKARTLTGDAADRWERERESVQQRRIVEHALAAMDAHGVDRARLVVLAEWMAEQAPELYHDLTEAGLGARLREAGAGTTTRIGAVDGLTKASGYTREQLAEALARVAA